MSDDVGIGRKSKKLRELGSKKKIGCRVSLWIA